MTTDQNTPLTARGYDPFLVDLCWTCVRLWSNSVVIAQSNICPFSRLKLSYDFRFHRVSPTALVLALVLPIPITKALHLGIRE